MLNDHARFISWFFQILYLVVAVGCPSLITLKSKTKTKKIKKKSKIQKNIYSATSIMKRRNEKTGLSLEFGHSFGEIIMNNE